MRELTHGINPPLLTELGLGAALEELCRQAALPATLELALGERPPNQVESAAYFLVSGALANAAKHSYATEVRVSARRDGDRLVVEVADDGIGGRRPRAGQGCGG